MRSATVAGALARAPEDIDVSLPRRAGRADRSSERALVAHRPRREGDTARDGGPDHAPVAGAGFAEGPPKMIIGTPAPSATPPTTRLTLETSSICLPLSTTLPYLGSVQRTPPHSVLRVSSLL